MKSNSRLFFAILTLSLIVNIGLAQTYPIVDTGVSTFFDENSIISTPSPGDPFYGQDAQYEGNQFSYTNNGDNTITDNITGLMWQSSPDHNGDNNGIIDVNDKLTLPEIQAQVLFLNSSNYAGHNDWRIPTIKELYSLTNWNGTDPSGVTNNSTNGLIPYLDDSYFDFAWGDVDGGERLIDVQYASSNLYNDLDCHGDELLFGFNFADGRIKGYGLTINGSDKTFSLICVRGNTSYGINDFIDNGDQTISDNATGLMWAKNDSQSSMNWEDALSWAETQNAAFYNGYNDWRVPNAKELQSILDYSRSPGSTNSAAINSIFNISTITNEAGDTDWPYFWSSTTHISYNGSNYGYSNSVYISFGRGAGWVQIPGNNYYTYCDVHGAGAQRSDPKSGNWHGELLGVDINGNNVYGWGPQGDIIRLENYVRLVRGSGLLSVNESKEINFNIYPNPAQDKIVILSDNQQKVITIYNMLGEKILEQSSNQNEITIDVSFLSNGIYLLELRNEIGETISKKIIIEN